MAYIGKEPANSFISFAKQDFTTSATTSYTLDNAVTNENELALFINFVRQEPTTAYTASGTSLTLTSATSATDDMYCVYLGKAVQTVNPPNGSVGLSQLSATGTKDSTTFLRGDNTFAVPSDNGKILNVYQVRTSTAVDVTSTSYVDIGLSQAVTPTSSSSKFLLRPNVHYSTFGGAEGFNLIINRAISGGSSTNLNDFPTNGAYLRYQDAIANHYSYFGYEWLDTPATASDITYKLQAKVTSSSSVKFSGYNSETVSMFTIMEVSG